jgi:RNA polymerase sigma factor (sigma-70 family)
MFERVFCETRTGLLAYLLRRSPSPEDAADALAETYLIAWAKRDALPGGEQARLWLFGVARNVLLQGASRRRFSGALVERLGGELRRAGAQEAATDDERVETLREALNALSARDREIVTLTAWEGLSPTQIAVAMGTSANAVRIRLHRARAQLLRALDPVRTHRQPEKRVAVDCDAGIP